MFGRKKAKKKETPKAKNMRLRRLLYISIIVFVVLFGGLLSYMIVSFSRFNIVRIHFSDNPTITENATIQFIFIGKPERLPNGSISGSTLNGGFLNQGIIFGDLSNLNDYVIENFDNRLLLPVAIDEIQITILWLNITEYPSTSPQFIEGDLIDITSKSSEIVIQSINAEAGTIATQKFDTNFFVELLFI